MHARLVGHGRRIVLGPFGAEDHRPLQPHGRSFALGRAVLFLLATFVVIISHGCHRDDIDTEPAVAPPLHAPRE